MHYIKIKKRKLLKRINIKIYLKFTLNLLSLLFSNKFITQIYIKLAHFN